MSSVPRQPLGVATSHNKQHHRASTVQQTPTESDGKLRRVLADGTQTDQKRKRSEREAQVTRGGTEQGATKSEVELMRAEYNKAKARIARREETIRSLSQARQRKPTEEAQKALSIDVEKKLADLVTRHHTTKAKYQAEMEALKREQSSLRTSNEELKIDHERNAAQLSEIESAKKLAERDNASLRQRLLAAEAEIQQRSSRPIESQESSSLAAMQKLEDECTQYRAAQHEFEREIKRLRLDNQRIPQMQMEKMEKMEAENDRLETLLEASAVSHALLHRSTVSKHDHLELRDKYAMEKMERRIWRTRAQVAAAETACKEKELKSLRKRLALVGAERNSLHDMVEDARAERTLLADELASVYARSSANDTVEPLVKVDHTPLVDLALAHHDLASSILEKEIAALSADRADLRSTLLKTETDLTSTREVLAGLQRSHADLQAVHSALEKDHSPCATAIHELTTDLSRAEEREGDTAHALAHIEERLDEAERKGRDDREALKRANDGVMRAKAAEDALDEEVQHLHQALLNAAPYEALYNDLLEKQAILESRENAAIDEAERLGLQNAELLGHTNSDQRISYIEGVRRDMALAKQELAATRHLLNKANDQVYTLEQEVEAYKSIDTYSSGGSSGAGTTLGGSTRIRVVRRQPEGGRVTLSTSTSASSRHQQR